MPAISSVLERVRVILENIHRPASVVISWVEFDERGDELAFHELETFPATSWSQIGEHLEHLRRSTRHQWAISALFVKLDTRVTEGAVEVWKADAGELLLTIDQPELHPGLGGARVRDVHRCVALERRSQRIGQAPTIRIPRKQTILGCRPCSVVFAGYSGPRSLWIVPRPIRPRSRNGDSAGIHRCPAARLDHRYLHSPRR